MNSSDRIRSHLGGALAPNRHHQEGCGDGGNAQPNTRGRHRPTTNVSSTAASALRPTTHNSNGNKKVHPLDTVEDTFDPIPINTIPSFVCDFSLFRVAKSMRLLGYDVKCEPAIQGETIIHVARAEKRIVITGSTRMLPQLAKIRRDDIEYRSGRPAPERNVVGYDSDGGSVYETDSDEDAAEDYTMSYVKVHSSDTHEESMVRVLTTLQLPWDESRVFTRCVDCNVLIESVPDKESVRGFVPSGVFEIYKNFYHCPCCKKVYWGVDGGVAVNYKSVRTIENLRQYRGAFANGGKKIDSAGIDKDGAEASGGPEATLSAAACSSPVSASSDNKGDGDYSTTSAVIRSHNGAPVDVMRAGTRMNRFADFTLRRHFSSLPRSIKQKIFAFLEPKDILAIADAVPTVRQLATAAAKGEVFVPAMNSRQLKREFRLRQLDAAQQTGQAPFVRGKLLTMMVDEDRKKAQK